MSFFVVLKGTKGGVFASRDEAQRDSTDGRVEAFATQEAASQFWRARRAVQQQQQQQHPLGSKSVFEREREKKLKRKAPPPPVAIAAAVPSTVVARPSGGALARVPANVEEAMRGVLPPKPEVKRRRSFASQYKGPRAAQLTAQVLAEARDAVEKLGPLLNAEQRRVVELAMAGKNVFFTGSAGTGKSLLLTYVVALLRLRGEQDGRGVAVTASTGVAAVNVQGVTLHKWACIGKGDGTPAELLRHVRRHPESANWVHTKVLVIDEISMIPASLWAALSFIGTTMRHLPLPFGGLQIIVCGDFLQLPPVGDVPYCFQCQEWVDCFAAPHGASVSLRNIYRQTDGAFLQMLSDIRVGRIQDEALQTLNRRCCRPLSSQDGIIATKLFPLNVDVDATNKRCLADLPGDEVKYHALDQLAVADDETTEAAAAAHKLGSDHPLFKSMVLQRETTLKVGAQVMLLWNLSEQMGLVNGSRGVVVGFKPSVCTVKSASPLLREWHEHNKVVPVVQFASMATAIDVEARERVITSRTACATRVSVPLALAWAVTVHKSMGLTLDRAMMDLSGAFSNGMVYVALSRVRNLDSLYLLSPIKRDAIRASADVVRYYDELGREIQQQAAPKRQ